MTCMTIQEAIREARKPANTSNMSEACFHRLDAARTLADEVERLRALLYPSRPVGYVAPEQRLTAADAAGGE